MKYAVPRDFHFTEGGIGVPGYSYVLEVVVPEGDWFVASTQGSFPSLPMPADVTVCVRVAVS